MNTVTAPTEVDAKQPSSLEQLETLVVLSSKEYSHAYARLAELKRDFDATKTALSPAEFSKQKDAIEQLEAVTGAKLAEKNRVEVAFADRYRRELAEKASGDRAQRESNLLAELRSLDLRLAELNGMYRNIPNLISAASDRKNGILRELVHLKEQSLNG